MVNREGGTVDKTKSYEISKNVVLEAYKRIRVLQELMTNQLPILKND